MSSSSSSSNLAVPPPKSSWKVVWKLSDSSLKLLGENLGHLLRDLADDVLQLALGLLHIVALVRQVGVAGVHPLELVDGPDVWGAQGGDVPLQLPDPPVGLGHALQLDPLCLASEWESS